jgi:hypothetical protein
MQLRSMETKETRDPKIHYDFFSIYFPGVFEEGDPDYHNILDAAANNRVIDNSAFYAEPREQPIIIGANLCTCWKAGFESAGGNLQGLDFKSSLCSLFGGEAGEILGEFWQKYASKNKMGQRLLIRKDCSGDYMFFDYSRNMLHSKKSPFSIVMEAGKVPKLLLPEQYHKFAKLSPRLGMDNNTLKYFAYGSSPLESLKLAKHIYSSKKELNGLVKRLK